MSNDDSQVTITLRIPGPWIDPGELMERLPAGCRLNPESLHIPEGAEIDFAAMPPDDQFPEIFATSCRQPPTEAELSIATQYRVNVGLMGPGGTLEAAQTMMQAGATIVEAGGAGVFIDNSGLAHGGGLWREMAADGGSDALSYGYVSIVGGRQDVYTMGMHVLGFPDIVMRTDDVDPGGDTVVEIIRHICGSEKPFGDGHVIFDESGPRFKAAAIDSDDRFLGSPMHNPYGRLKFSSFKSIAEGN